MKQMCYTLVCYTLVLIKCYLFSNTIIKLTKLFSIRLLLANVTNAIFFLVYIHKYWYLYGMTRERKHFLLSKYLFSKYL